MRVTPREASAAGRAAERIALGYGNAKALEGGVDGWRRAGYPFVKAA